MHEADRPALRPIEADPVVELDDPVDDDRLVLGDLLNHVLDKGVVLTGEVTISIADIDLVRVGLSVVIAAVATLERRAAGSAEVGAPTKGQDANVPLLPPSGRG